MGNGDSTDATISADGRYVAFTSTTENLIASDKNASADIFLVDRDADNDGVFISDAACTPDTMSIVRVSVVADGTEGNGDSTQPDLSGNSAWIAFTSDATNLFTKSDTNNASDVFLVFLGYPMTVTNTPLAVGVRAVGVQDRPMLPLLTLLIAIGTLWILKGECLVFAQSELGNRQNRAHCPFQTKCLEEPTNADGDCFLLHNS